MQRDQYDEDNAYAGAWGQGVSQNVTWAACATQMSVTLARVLRRVPGVSRRL